MDPISARKAAVAGVRRVVVKVGSRLLGEADDVRETERINELIEEVHWLRQQEIEVILVSSGAIGAGMAQMGQRKRPRALPRLQALAAVGQCRLMALYENACRCHGFHAAQILLSRFDLKNRRSHLNMCNCIYSLLASGTLPVINENDTVSVDEIRFGDNDILAAMMATMIRADLTILLTSVDGLCQRHKGTIGDRIPIVTELTDEIRGFAGGTDGNALSSGGMLAKLNAAELCMTAGEPVWIGNGTDFSILRQMMAGDDVGTLFVPGATKLAKSKRWLAFFTDPAGEVIVDRGAAAALIDSGKSLLPIGITGIRGDFDKGDTVNICASDAVIGLGISNYSAAELRRIHGRPSSEIPALLGENGYDEAIHRDNLVIV